MRRLCNMFKASLKAPPKGVFTEYPHLNHASIDSLFNRCKELYDEDPTQAPTIIIIKTGEHVVIIMKKTMRMMMKFIVNRIFWQGFEIEGEKEEGKNVVLKDMTILISETSDN